MARPKSPEGKRVTICAKFSEAQAAEIDTARGHMDRSEWLRQAALAAAERQRPPTGHVGRQVAAARVPREPESASDIMAAIRRRTGA